VELFVLGFGFEALVQGLNEVTLKFMFIGLAMMIVGKSICC
jgi:hypothetical protein